ncbi:MAG: MinD/ParA family protein, partial [Spirochaetales bacterium]|nr:MinD/ParA family protein [Spirochaetales bacterium]
AAGLEELVVETQQQRLFLIPGDGLFAGTANLPYWRKLALMKELERLTADFVILDLGSGSTFNTLDLFLVSPAGLIVTTPDTTAILNAYSFLKASMLRLLQRSFPGKSEERRAVLDFMETRVEGSDMSIHNVLEAIASIDAESGQRAEEALENFRPRIVMNMGRSAEDIKLGTRLRMVARDNLKHDLEFVAYLPQDELTSRSPLERRPTMLTYPQSQYSRAVTQCATRIIHEPIPELLKLFPDDEDIQELAEGFAGRSSEA